MSRLHLKVKCLDWFVCTVSTNSKSKKTWWEWSKQNYTKCTMYCKYISFGGVFVALEEWLGWNDTSIMTHSLSKLASYISKKFMLDRIDITVVHDLEWIARKTPIAEAVFEPWIPNPCLSLWLSGMRIWGVPELQWFHSKSCGWAMNKWALVSYSDISTQYCLDCQMGLAKMQFGICHEDMPRILRFTETSTITQHILRLCHKSPDTGTQYCLVCFNWQMRLVNMEYLIMYEEMPWILRCTRESWAHIVMTNRSLHSLYSDLV